MLSKLLLITKSASLLGVYLSQLISAIITPTSIYSNVLFTAKSHLLIYPCPSNINYFYNIGFMLAFSIVIQVISGLLLTLYFINTDGYFSLIYIIKEIYFGFIVRYLHTNNASFIFVLAFLHIGRNLYYRNYYYHIYIWFSGIFLFFLLIVISFLGYILSWGQISYWGATVITNLLSIIPYFIKWISGNYYISVVSLKRYFIFHFILPFVLLILLYIHIYYLHFISSSNPLDFNNLDKIPFTNYLLLKDYFGFLLIFTFFCFQIFFIIFSLSHPDNLLTINYVVTPLHIIPEWYFLTLYSILKAIPNKNTGFICIIIVLYVLILFGEFKYQIAEYTKLMRLWSLFIIFILLLWIGCQLPQDLFIYYGRLCLYLYLLIISMHVTLIK